MRTAEVELKGTTPLLMHAYPLGPVENIEKKSKEDQAELVAYRDEHGMLFIPSVCVQRALVSGATFQKGKGRGSLQKVAAACLMVEPDRLTLGTKKYSIDSRPVVVPATKGRVMRHRPKLEDWKVRFHLTWDENLLTEPQVKRILDDCGIRVGLLDFRPEKKGPFGKFLVAMFRSNGGK